MTGTRQALLTGLGAGAALLALAGCELAPKSSRQTGYRGTGLAQVSNTHHKLPDDSIPPEPYPLGPDTGPRAREQYANLQVLGDLSADEFNRLMMSITSWVAPQQGCTYCHDPENLASDKPYTKRVARRMIQMTRAINGQWASHVKQTGVTCYTCHRGENVPLQTWTMAPAGGLGTVRGNRHGQNSPDPNVGYAALPFDPFNSYLKGKTDEIRVASSHVFPSGAPERGIKDAEGSYGLMMHISSALGVNCTFCHNSQSFRSWNESTPQRALAFYGIRMVRDINADYIGPLAAIFPPARLGPAGDARKVNCATCHQGKNKPLGGFNMLKDNPALGPRRAPPIAAAAPVPALAAPARGAATGR